jgi:predicted DNA-binding protein
MPSLSLQQIRTYIDRLGDLENELTRSCKVAEIMAKGAGKDLSSASERLKDACEDAKEHCELVGKAKDRLLEFDGFMHAQSARMKDAMERPNVVRFLNEVGGRMGTAMETHVEALVSDTIESLRRLAGAVKDLREAKEGSENVASAKESAKALDKACSAAEKAISKGLQERASAPAPEEVEDDVEEEIEVFEGKMAHGYNLTAKELPPEFLENAKKKKEEAAAKKDEEDEKPKKASHGYVLTAESRVPGNESKGPKDEGEEDEGWVPGHRTEDKDKKASHGYRLDA